MENELILLQDIKAAIWILIYLIGISVSFTILRALISVFKVLKEHYEDKFTIIAEALFENNDIDSLIEYCHKNLKKKPKMAYAHWFLGKAYFHKKEYDAARKHFNTAAEINPSWETDWVGPYLRKIHLATSTDNNALNQTGANNAPPG